MNAHDRKEIMAARRRARGLKIALGRLRAARALGWRLPSNVKIRDYSKASRLKAKLTPKRVAKQESPLWRSLQTCK